MASKCPNCGRVLKWYNIKADCPDCGISIPNFNWEARLEEDNKKAEEKFGKFYRTLNMLKYSVAGTKLRIARIVLSFLPAIGFILPWASIGSDKDTLSLDLLGLFTDGTITIDFFGILFKNIGDIFSAISGEGFSGPVTYFMAGLLMMLLGIITIVVAFFLIFIKFRKPKTNAVWIADALSIAITFVAAVLFTVCGKSISGTFSIGTLTFDNAHSGILWGIFVYVALLAVALIANILVSKADITSEDDLEAARLEKVRLKEEKAEADRIRKEAERAEAKKRAEAEEAEKIRKAKESLASKKNK
ncbi:MAG: hypothetical protein IJW86_07975 [Clostridia bacterium]|nr:hypothetical protein [Clostridia bacterium]